MILGKGSNILASHRRLFSEDLPRFFLGTVEEYEQGIALVSGFSWQIELTHGTLTRNEDKRRKIISLSSGTLLIYRLPDELDMDTLCMRHEQHRILLTDNAGFEMDLSYRHSGGL